MTSGQIGLLVENVRTHSQINLSNLADRLHLGEEDLVSECKRRGFTVTKRAGALWAGGRIPRIWRRDKDGQV